MPTNRETQPNQMLLFQGYEALDEYIADGTLMFLGPERVELVQGQFPTAIILKADGNSEEIAMSAILYNFMQEVMKWSKDAVR